MTPAGIEPATFRFIAQHLNHCATAVPHTMSVSSYNEYWPEDGLVKPKHVAKHCVILVINQLDAQIIVL